MLRVARDLASASGADGDRFLEVLAGFLVLAEQIQRDAGLVVGLIRVGCVGEDLLVDTRALQRAVLRAVSAGLRRRGVVFLRRGLLGGNRDRQRAREEQRRSGLTTEFHGRIIRAVASAAVDQIAWSTYRCV